MGSEENRRTIDALIPRLLADVAEMRSQVDTVAKDGQQRMMVVERIEKDVLRLTDTLRTHMESERAIIAELGEPMETRARVEFVNMLIKREAERSQMRRAVIEKTIIGAVWAVIAFTALAIWNQFGDALRDLLHLPPKGKL